MQDQEKTKLDFRQFMSEFYLKLHRSDGKMIFIWSLLATAAASLSTTMYALLIYKKPWAHEFIQLYAIVGFSSGWINTAILYFTPHHAILQRRLAGIAFYFFTLLIALLSFRFLFPASYGIEKFTFLIGAITPVLFTSQFAARFASGDFRGVYSRTIGINIFLISAALFTIFKKNQELTLYRSTLISGIFIFLYWLTDSWPNFVFREGGKNPMRGILNPATASLERTVWDQWVLSQFFEPSWSFALFVGSKLITFTGNVVQNYTLGRSLNTQSERMRFIPKITALVIFAASLIAVLGTIYSSRAALLLGSIVSWLLGISLSGSFKATRGNLYETLISIWLIDFFLRITILYNTHDLNHYIKLTTPLNMTIILAVFFVHWRFGLKATRNSTKTISPLEDFPGTH